MKIIKFLIFLSIFINIPLFAYAGENLDTVYFEPEINSEETFVLQVQKTEKDKQSLYDKLESVRTDRINMHDYKAIRKISTDVTNEQIFIDKNTKVIIGNNALSSINDDVSISFISRIASSTDYGVTVNTRGDFLNVSSGVYSSTKTTSNSGGVAIATNPIKMPLGSMIVGSAVYNSNLENYEGHSFGVFNKYKYKKFILNTQISTFRMDTKGKDDKNTIFLSPEFALNKSLSIKTSLRSDMYDNSNRKEIAINYHPYKSSRNLELEMALSANQNENQITSRRFKFLTKFKI